MEDKELWMNKMKEKLANYSEPIPNFGWEQLEKQLMPSRPIERKIFPYRRWGIAAVAAAFVALISSVSIYFLQTPTAEEVRQLSTKSIANIPNVLPDKKVPNIKGEEIAPLVNSIHGKHQDKIAKVYSPVIAPVHRAEANIDQKQNEKADKPVENFSDASVVNDQNTIETPKEDKDKVDSEKAVVARAPRKPSSRDKLNIPVDKPSSKSGKWSTGVSVGNALGSPTANSINKDLAFERVNLTALPSGMVEIPKNQILYFENGVPFLRSLDAIKSIDHHQPISLGISFRKELKYGFSLETGLIYTLLSSDAKMYLGEKLKQQLHYVGIPIRANWSFYNKKLLSMYVAGGGTIEKSVYGKLGSEKLTVKPLQFSLSGAVGVQVNATSNIGFYVEPGVSYFFNDGSDVQTIRKENPFNFNLQAGIRFTY